MTYCNSIGNVINKLSKSKKKHTSWFRDSKLTRILQDSLGGNSISYMISCISGDENDYEETLSTLYYASKAKLIQNQPVVNEDASLVVVNSLKKEIFNLKSEIIKFKRFISSDILILKKWKQRRNDFNEEKEIDFDDFDQNNSFFENETMEKHEEKHISRVLEELIHIITKKKALFEEGIKEFEFMNELCKKYI